MVDSDIYVSESDMTFTLVDNSGAADLILPGSWYDWYYTIIPYKVTNVAVICEDNYKVEVGIVDPDTTIKISDFFSFGLKASKIFGNNVIAISTKAGTNMTNINQVIQIRYGLKERMIKKYICGKVFHKKSDIWNFQKIKFK